MKYRLWIAAAGIAVMAAGSVSFASHSWGNYHWARSANPLSLKLGDNVSTEWDLHLATASADWSLSTVLDTSVVAGSTNPKNCRPKSGRVEICNSKYGNNGWLGVASIWVSGGHIAQGTVKLNDTYFNTPRYNTPEWRLMVMCQEIGHTFGLDHQDEDFTNPNLGSCMDYTSDPSTNQHPNQHDYDQLETIYGHLDSSATAAARGASGSGAAMDASGPAEWGRLVKLSKDGGKAIYERELGKGQKLITFVLWAR